MDNIQLRKDCENPKHIELSDSLLLIPLEAPFTSDECLMRAGNLEPQASNRHAEHDYECHDGYIQPLRRHKALDSCAVETSAVVLRWRWSHKKDRKSTRLNSSHWE